MDFSAIIYAAIGAGLGAGLGSLLTSLLFKSKEEAAQPAGQTKKSSGTRGGLTGGLAVLGMLAVQTLYKNMTLPRIFPMDDSEILDTLPIYQVIKDQSPDDYDRLLGSVDRAVRNGKIDQSTLNDMRVVFYDLTAEKTSNASANVLRFFEGVAQSQYEVYRDKKPEICTLLLNDEPYPDVSSFLTQVEIDQEQDAMVKLFTEPPRDESFSPDLAQGEELIENIFLGLMADIGVKNLRPEILDTPENKLEHERMCDLAIAFSEKKKALNDEELLNVISYLNAPE